MFIRVEVKKDGEDYKLMEYDKERVRQGQLIAKLEELYPEPEYEIRVELLGAQQ